MFMILKYFSTILAVYFLFFSPSLATAATPLNLIDTLPIHEAFMTKFSDSIPLFYTPAQPPAPNPENIPPKTFEDAIWIPGYWAWLETKNDFIWICGVWRRPPIGHHWISGNWYEVDGNWAWAKGFWSNIPFDQLKYIEKAPPIAITDKMPSSPGKEYFWAPGYWNYSDNSKNYSWLSGKWELSNPNWILAPSYYIWHPSGFIFNPPYWDWPLDMRGTAYACNDISVPLVVIEPQIIIQKLFYCYPDYNIFYWHWWHFHPDWNWDGCGCIPPWWSWHQWWFLDWSNSWGLWWWWCHPGAFPPFWLNLELSLQIEPPPLAVIEAFKKLPKPLFHLKLGNNALLPKGTPGKKDIPLPMISNNVTSGGQISLPALPQLQITIPPVPSLPQNPTQPNDPLNNGYYPSQNYVPEPYYPSRNEHIPPKYHPSPNHKPHHHKHDDHNNEPPPTNHPKYPDNPYPHRPSGSPPPPSQTINPNRTNPGYGGGSKSDHNHGGSSSKGKTFFNR